MVKLSTLIFAALVGVVSAAPMPGSSSSDGSSNSNSSSSGSSDCGSSGCGSSQGSSSYGSSSGSSYGGSSSMPPPPYGSSSGSSSYDGSSSMPPPPSSNSYGSNSNSYGSSSNSYGSNSNSYGSNSYNSSSSSSSSDCGYAGCDSSTTTVSADMSMQTSSYSMPSYGSGYSGNSGYDSCVQQCVAQYGMPSSMSMPPPPSETYGSSGDESGSTHTVIVAPTKGVLRYVPFAVNASVGDTIKFVWMAGPHTVTKSSEFSICNKTAEAPFASGPQNASFVFTQRVNDTNATFFYCGVPTHCEKGMFGIINPPNALVQPDSVANMMGVVASSDPATAAGWSSISNITGPAASWGDSIDLSGMESWQQTAMVDNVIYTRSFLAANPSVIDESGNVDLSSLSPDSMMIPKDIVAAANASPSTSTPAGSTGGAGGAADAGASAPAQGTSAENAAAAGATAPAKSGAGALVSPRSAVAAVALAAAFFAL